MDLHLAFFAFLCLGGYSAASEYKVCATVEHEHRCKLIEAATNEITCVRVSDSVDCLLKMQKNEADFGTFYPEEAFLAARFLGRSGVVLAEVRHADRASEAFGFETVVVTRDTLLGGLSELAGRRYCHPGFSKAQHWSDRVLKAFEAKVLEQFNKNGKCNSSARSAYEDDLHGLSTIFRKACRPGAWVVGDWWDKKLKREYHRLCEQCDDPRTCSYKVMNRGRHSNALKCLTQHDGDVTYTALEFVKEYFYVDSAWQTGPREDPSDYEFLCPDGSTQSLHTSEPCTWVRQPWPSVVASRSAGEQMLENLRRRLQAESTAAWRNLREILAKDDQTLHFRDDRAEVADYIKEGRSIPDADAESCRRALRWCTIGATEKKKCEYISTAASTHGLPVRLRCVDGASKMDCLAMISHRDADVVYVDTELGYVSRQSYNLTAAAYLETQRTGNYYGVLVTKGSSVRELKDLRGKRACFPQYNGLGWLTYVDALKSSSEIPDGSCANSKAVWTHFSQTCAPGAKDPSFNPAAATAPDRLCKACGNPGAGGSCEATSANPYFGEIGALRCLNNGDGDVAFLNFHVVQKYLESSRRNASDCSMNSEDFSILCRDGSLEKFSTANPDKCSFTQINGGEVVSRNDLAAIEKRDIQQTLMELDDLFGTTSRAYYPALRMFQPFDGETDVLFKESAVSLVTDTQNRFVGNYLKLLAGAGDCTHDSGSSAALPSALAIGISVLFVFFQP